MRAGRLRTHVAYRWRRAGSPRSRHAGWTPAHPRGISPEAGWKPAYPGGVSLYAGETPALPACGLDACAPMRCRGEGAHRCMRARRPRSRHASWKPAPPACELKARAPRHAGCKPAHPACGCDARVLRGGVRSCDPARYTRHRTGRPVTLQRTFRAFFVGIRSVIGAIATRCIVWQIVVVHGAESSL